MADPIDVAVGVRVRTRRKSMGLSQRALAEHLGLTFQQVQKYERGTNRVSASMLVHIAEKLECSVSMLIGETERGVDLPDSDLLSGLLTSGASDLLRAYNAIGSTSQRQTLLKLARAMAEDDDQSDDEGA
jgi:transcriptional regulator with XRE-family HTH domain